MLFSVLGRTLDAFALDRAAGHVDVPTQLLHPSFAAEDEPYFAREDEDFVVADSGAGFHRYSVFLTEP